MKILHFIQSIRVPMNQSTSGSARLWEPRRHVPPPRLFLGLLAAAGVSLALAQPAQADCPLPTVNAGPNQYLIASPTNGIQLTGSVGNGATNATWSGGSGTFSPNAQTTNAVYTPSAAERAAGSWALILTASSPCGTATSSMSFFFVPVVTLPLLSDQSPEVTTIGMNVSVLLVPYGWQYDSATNLNSGYVTVAILYTNGEPTAVSLQDYNFAATGPGDYSWNWWDALNGFFINGAGTASNQVTFDSAPGPQNPFYPVYGDIHNEVNFTNIAFGTSGSLSYTNTEYVLFTASGNLAMTNSGVSSTNAAATIFVTNGVIWLQIPFTSWGSNGTPFLSGSSASMTFVSSGAAVASGPVPAESRRALVWNNGAGTGDWNTSDANWNVGTATWNNDAPDNAIFANTGVGTVTLTIPITAGWLDFSYPGYTITGSTLALSSASTITNDADATIASGIISGAMNKWGPGTLTLASANSYSGASTVNAGTLQLGNSSALPGTDLTLGSGASPVRLDLHGYNGTVAMLAGGANAVVDNLSGGASTLIVGNNGASSSFGGVIRNTAGTVSLAKIGNGTLALSSANTYSGNTIISAGTLALGSSTASLSSASSVSIAAGATFDVSAAAGSYYLLGSGATLTASGTASPATINGPPYGGTVDLGSRPIVLNYDGTHPALTVAQSTLYLNGNTITVDSPLSLNTGSYPVIQATGGGSILTNGSFTVNGTAIPGGYGAYVSVSGTQLMVNVYRILALSTTTVGPFAPSQTYGSIVLGATVSPSAATGTVTFYSGTTNVGTATLSGGVATGPAIASLLPAGVHPITAKYGGDSTYAGSSSATSSNLTVTAKMVSLTGSKTYDKTAAITPATGLTITPNLDGANVYLSPANGAAVLAGWNAGMQVITNVSGVTTNVASITTNVNFNTPTRVQSAGATGGSWSYLQAASFSVTLPANTTAGNLLVAMINTLSTSADKVTSVTGAGATWTKLTEAVTGSIGGCETELWYANNIAGGGSTVNITLTTISNLVSFSFAEAVVMEYTNVTTTPLDVYASGSGGSSPASSGTTAAMGQACELCVAGIGTESAAGYCTLSGQSSGWDLVDNQQMSASLLGLGANSTIYAYEHIATNGGTASCSASESGLGISSWAGVIATFKATLGYPFFLYTTNYSYTTNYTLTLAGPAAGNYSLVYTGAVTINPYPVTVSATTASKTYDGTTVSPGYATVTPSGGVLVGGDTYTPASPHQYFNSRNAAPGNAVVVPAPITISDGNSGNNYTLTYNNYTGGTISPKVLTVLNLSAQSKTYDGTTNAAVGGTAAFITPPDAPGGGSTSDGTPYVVDPVSPGGSPTGAFVTPYVGTNKTVTVTGVTVTGTGSGNYTAMQPSLTANITNLPVQLIGSKNYNGTTTVLAGNLSITNNHDGANLTLSGSATLNSRNVGASVPLVSVAGLTLGGSMATNYTLAGATGSATVTATNLTVTAAPNAKIYDGTTSATNTPTITAGSIQAGDTAPVWTEIYDTPSAGTGKALIPAQLVVNDGNYGTNYAYTYLTNYTGVISALATSTLLAADINPSVLATRVTFTATVSGVLPAATLPTGNVVFMANGTAFATNGPLVAGTGSGSISASTASLPVGTNTITAQYLGSGNFQPSTSAALSEVVTNWGAVAITNQVANVTNCAGMSAIFTVEAIGNNVTYQWQVSSNGGTTFTNVSATATNASYTNLATTVAENGYLYQVIVSGSGGSSGTLSVTSMPPALLVVYAPATASAGGNQTICAGSSTAGLGGTVGGSATGGTWTTSGSGTFAPNGTTLNATYAPSAGDVIAGGVTLTLTSTGQAAPCPAAATAQVVVAINTAPTASAGGSQTICAGSSMAALAGTVGGSATGGTWTTSGSGTFTPDATTLNATYVPSAGDATAGTVTLTLSSTGQPAPCAAATAQVVATINEAATVGTGGNQTIYSDRSTVGLGGTVGGGATGGIWFSSGTGTFSPNATTLNAIYHPSAADVSAGSVTLTLNSTGQLAPCLAATAQMIVTIVPEAPTVTVLGGVATPQPYGSTLLTATVTTNGVGAVETGFVTFMAGGINLATVQLTNGFASLATNLGVPGSPYAIQAVFSDPTGEYYGSASGTSNVTITARAVALAGSKTYDKTAVITPATGLTVSPNYDGANVYLAPPTGAATLAGSNAGPESITNTASVVTNIASITTNFNYNTPTRVQYAGGTGGSWSSAQAASFSVTLTNNATAGNTLVAVINTDSDSTNRVSGVSGAGATSWTQLGQAENGTSCPWGSETEMWYAPSVSGGDNSVTITLNSTANLTKYILAEAVIVEYGNLITAPLDASNSASGGSSPAASGSVTTTQSYEVWVAGLGTANSSGYRTLSGQSSGWNLINSQSKNNTLSGTGTYNIIYAYDQMATNTGTAVCSATESGDTAWAGVIGTFKATIGYPTYVYTTNYATTTNYNVALAGAAATNYTLVYTGAVTINPYPVTVAATSASKIYDGTTTASGSATVTPSGGTLIGTDTYSPAWPGQSFASRNAAVGSAVVVPAAITVTDGNGGANYSVTYSNYTGGTISARALTVTAATNTKKYDGTTSATNTPALTAGSIQIGDTAPAWIETYDTPDAGTNKTLTPAGVVLDGNGGANYQYTYAPNVTGVITALTTTTLLGSGVNPSALGADVTFTATVSDAGPYPTGNVVFSANGTPFATNGLSMLTSASSAVTASTTALPAGTNSVVAQYLGTLNYQPSISSPLAQVVTNGVIYSRTNIIISIVNRHDGGYTLNFTGTAGAQYYVVSSGSVAAHMTNWIPVADSTNTASNPLGTWSCVVSNPAPAYYRPVAVNPAP
jgi:autotransporter-associated beta strand protein